MRVPAALGLLCCFLPGSLGDCPKCPAPFPPNCIKSCGDTCQFVFPGIPPFLAECTAGQVLTSNNTCGGPGGCTATDIKVSQPAVSKTPSYTWGISATLTDAVTAPTWHAGMVISHPHKLNHGANDAFGINNGSACGSNHTMRLGIGAPGGERSPVWCPSCTLVLDFPPCPWVKGQPLEIKVKFSMNYWVVPNLDAYNTTVSVKGDKGEQLLSVRSFGDLLTKLPPALHLDEVVV